MMCAAPTPKLPGRTETAGMLDATGSPLAGAMAFSAIGFGLWSQAVHVWVETASAMAQMSLRAMSGRPTKPVANSAIAPGSKPVEVRTEAAVRTMMADAAQVADAAVEVAATVTAPAKPVRAKRIKAGLTAASKAIVDVRQPKAMAKPKKADDLKAIAGIGPKLETVLNGLGIWTYKQIAGWTADEVAWVDDYLSFSGRIGRDDWIGQAKTLAKPGR